MIGCTLNYIETKWGYNKRVKKDISEIHKVIRPTKCIEENGE